ncbi:chromatin remodeling complex WSTF-ISWI, large subunit [Cryomyces antarcticus]
MVQFKRKPVQYLSRPSIQDDHTEVWVMDRTGEVFTDYESYLQRRDFYKQKKFTCTITGHSGLSFFDALDSEMEGSREVNSLFPDALREPVLRKVQFSTISRIDELVNHVFEEFKHEFFPGEQVTALVEDGQKLEGTVREKAKFPELRRPDGSLQRKAFSRYFVRLAERSGDEALLDDEHLIRERRVFTKQMLRSFLKNTLTREAWSGAPWIVKERVAKDYRIPTEVPSELQYGARSAATKERVATKNAGAEDTFFDFLASQTRLPELKPTKGQKIKLSQQDVAKFKQEQVLQYDQALANGQGPTFAASHFMPPQFQMPYANHLHQFSTFQPIATPVNPPRPAAQIAPPPKYPIDDLDVTPRANGVHRPNLKFFSDDTPSSTGQPQTSNGIQMKSVGLLLEVWNTLNVHAEIFKLDSFTFDDFVGAMQFSSDEIECELLVEAHCAVLKLLVNEEGQVQVALPAMFEIDEEEDDGTSVDDSALSTPIPDVNVRASGRTTRSSLAKSEVVPVEEPTPASEHQQKAHRAAEMITDYAWVERIKARDFQDGGWQAVMVGLLYQVSLNNRQKEKCEQVLAKLAPIDMEATQETARQQYIHLDVNLRIVALEIVCMLAVQTKTMRDYLMQSSEDMTEHRNARTDWQRKKKAFVEELRELDDQRKILLPENTPASPEPDVAEAADVSMNIVEDTEDAGGATDDAEDDVLSGRSLRRGTDRALDRKRKRDQDSVRKEKERKEKAEATKASKQSAQFKKLLKDIEKKKDAIKECEDKISELNIDLRETDCHRTRALGRDRFFNRYYWFERNGMPFAGVPSGSNMDNEYANGRIWVQGPDDLERKGFIDLSDAAMSEYIERHRMTPQKRKEVEEGPTRLYDAGQWGYYDNPDTLDMLIGWLDDRGKREKDLRKELQNWRETIVELMHKMTAQLAEKEEKKAEGEEQATRVSTRHKTYINLDATKHSCLAYRNMTAIEQLGHLHSEQPRPRPKKFTKKAPESKIPTGKTGKPLTRQGTRYGRH